MLLLLKLKLSTQHFKLKFQDFSAPPPLHLLLLEMNHLVSYLSLLLIVAGFSFTQLTLFAEFKRQINTRLQFEKKKYNLRISTFTCLEVIKKYNLLGFNTLNNIFLYREATQ